MQPVQPRLLTPQELEDESRYVIARDVPVFAVNVRTKNGQQVKVTKADLERALATAKRNEKRNTFAVMTLGHRKMKPDVKETDQPEPRGYARFHRVGEVDGEPVLFASMHYDRDTAAESLTYPFRSVDYYAGPDEITGVALLRRDPELNLGVLTYAREGFALRYHDEAAMNPDTMQPGNPTDPAAPPDAEAPDPGFMNQYQRCTKHLYPHMDKMHSSYAATMPPAKPEEMNMDKAAPTPPAMPAQMQRQADPATYALEQQLKATNESLRKTQLELLTAKRKGEIEQYARSRDVDVLVELSESMNCDGRGTPESLEQFQKRTERFARHALKEADLGSLPNVGLRLADTGAPSNGEPTARECAAVNSYCKEELKEGRYKSWEEGLEAVRAQKKRA